MAEIKSSISFFQKFKRYKKGYYSFLILSFLFIISCFADFIANDKPLVFKYKENYYFPIIKTYTKDQFLGDLSIAINYKSSEFIEEIEQNGWLIWPIWRYKYNTTVEDVKYYPYPPTTKHFLGVDDNGRDIFALVLYSYRVSLLFGVFLSLFKILLGTIIGIINGYFGGWIDIILHRISSVISTIPSLLILIVFNTFYCQNFWSLILILGLLDWVRIANIVRLECFQLKKSGFVLYSKSLGISNKRIILFQFTPHLLYVLLSYFPFSIISSISILVSFDFLGIGLPYGSPSLGEVLNQARSNLHQPSIAIIGIFLISTTLMMIFFISENLNNTQKNSKFFT